MGNRKRAVAYGSVAVLVVVFIQGCAVIEWHNRLMQSAMDYVGLGGHGSHGGAPEARAGVLASNGLCQAVAYLDYRDELGLTSEQLGKLKDLDLNCQREMSGKDTERKAAEQEYQALLGDLARNKTERSRVEAKSKEVGELYARMFLIPVDYREKAMAVLTAEQRERLGTISPSKSKAGQHKH